ncbi:MAG: radical SAM protein, partial [Spirochaetales bacterium]
MTAGFFTLGCKLNQYETEGIADSFKNLGITVIPALRSLDEQADLYIINTCTVTSKSEQKARRVIRKLLKDHPGARVIVTGCYAQVDAESLKNIDSRVRVVPQDDKPSLLTLASSLLDREPEAVPGKFDYMPSSYSFHTRAFLKIQDGCDNFCSYCRVPFARGASVSSPSARVLERAGVLAAKGFGEIVITGVNISAFRDPEKPDYGLPRLIENLAASVPGVRLRVSSLEPESINEELLAVLMHPTICPHFHLPVQSGS